MKDENDDIRREVRKLLAPIQEQIDATNERIVSVGQAVVATANATGFAEIVNIINNSHPEWSKAAYTTLGVLSSDAGDTNLEAYNFFRQPAADTDITQSSAHALKAAKTSEPADHTLWAANEGVDDDIPRWDKTNSMVEMGGVTTAWDLFVPIAQDVVFPGQIFYVQFEAMLRTSTALPNIQVYAGIYDETAGQRKYIEGGSFTITDDNGNDPGVTFGIPGSTSVDYKVIAYTDSGEQAESNVLNFPNAPAVFDGSNHPRVRFAGVPGFIKFEIYRKIGSTYVLQYTVGNTIEGIYADVGNPPQAVVSAFPSIGTNKPRAYAVTTTFLPGSLTGSGWVRHALTIQVPLTYNRSVTGAGMQYFRFGFNGLTTDARQVLIRRFGLSMGSAKWARSPEDVRPGAHSSISASAAGAGSSGGGGVDPPPPSGGGGHDCVLLDSTLRLIDRDVELRHGKKDDVPDSGGAVCGKLISVSHAHTSRIYRVETESGLKVGCTYDHPFITSRLNFTGTPAIRLKAMLDRGEPVFVLVMPKNQIFADRIISMVEEYGDFWVGIPSVDGPHTVILNGFLSHNRKEDPIDPFFV